MAKRAQPRPAGLQTDLFPAPTNDSGRPDSSARVPSGTRSAPAASKPLPSATPLPETRAPSRTEGLQTLLEVCPPVRAGSRAAAWLKSRRVFKKTWDAQMVRVVDDYRRVTEDLLARFSAAQWTAWGVFNKEGHLRFYRHTILLPWFDGGHPVYLQARSPDPEVTPAELSVTGSVPCPYNAHLLDGEEGRLYLCMGALDTLELLDAGFPAVGVPAGMDLRPAWLPRFRNKSVFLAYDADADGEAAAAKAIALLNGQGVDAHRLRVPAGKRVGDWLAGK